jgi:hypothetical protein
MNIPSRIFLGLLFLLFFKSNFAQVANIPYYNNLNFNDSFFKIAETDAKSNYYVVNLSFFASSIERVYFENLAFNESKLIRLDAGNPNVAWFKVKKVYSDEETANLFLGLKNRTINSIAIMSESQKQEWLTTIGK